MKFTSILAGSLASLASAHSDPREAHSGVPKLMGGRSFLSYLRARNALPDLSAVADVEEREPPVYLEERQDANGRCGVGFGASCAAGECCSPEGWCGTTSSLRPIQNISQ
jgi:hypothetical protein